jgi:hypothetical protein
MVAIIKFDPDQALSLATNPLAPDQPPVSPLDFANHLLSFIAPAVVVAVLVALGARLVLPASAPPRPLWLAAGLNALAGVLALLAGLWYFGHDGKMATYSALVLAVATMQWAGGRAWRS